MRMMLWLMGIMAFLAFHSTAFAGSSLDGTSWRVELYPSTVKTPSIDHFRFDNGVFSSPYFKEKGFAASHFTPREVKGKPVIWETLQTGKGRDTVSWHGEVEGDIMRGVASMVTGGTRVNITFVGRRIDKAAVGDETLVGSAPSHPETPALPPKAKPKAKKAPAQAPPQPAAP